MESQKREGLGDNYLLLQELYYSFRRKRCASPATGSQSEAQAEAGDGQGQCVFGAALSQGRGIDGFEEPSHESLRDDARGGAAPVR